MNNDTNTAKQYIPANFTTHRSAWRKAIELAIENAKSGSVDEDEKAYWEHELAAFDRSFSRLLDNPEPVRDALDTKDAESTTVRFCEDVLADIANRLGVTVGDELPTTAALILEALEVKAAAQSVVPLSAELMRALGDARELAMHNTAAARIPECGDFGNIAQNLDWAVEEIKRTATGPVPSAVPPVSDEPLTN